MDEVKRPPRVDLPPLGEEPGVTQRQMRRSDKKRRQTAGVMQDTSEGETWDLSDPSHSGVGIGALSGFGASGGLLQSDGSAWVRVDNISYDNLPTGGGTWALGGDLTVSGGDVLLEYGEVGIGPYGPDTSFGLVISRNGLSNLRVLTASNTATDSSGWNASRARGTINGLGDTSGLTAVQSGDRLAVFSFGGWNGSALTNGARMIAVTTENWSGSANGTQIVWEVTPDGSTTGAERMRLYSGGQLILGPQTTPVSTNGVSDLIQMHGSVARMALGRWQNANTNPARFTVAKSRSATVGTWSIVLDGDTLGEFAAVGDDGTDFGTVGGAIAFAVNGTPGLNLMPTEIQFRTAAGLASNDISTKWTMAPAGHFLAATDNAYDIGASGATRPRSGYFGTSVVIGGVPQLIGNVNSKLQVLATDATAGIGFGRWGNNANPPLMLFGKSRGASVGALATVQSGDFLSRIVSYGDDGVDMITRGAEIHAVVESTPSANRIPTYLAFMTSAGVSDDDIAEAWRITSTKALQSPGANTIQTATGNLTLATAAGNGNIVLSPHGTGWIEAQKHLLFSADNTYDIGASGATRPKNLYVANNVLIGRGVLIGSDTGYLTQSGNSSAAPRSFIYGESENASVFNVFRWQDNSAGPLISLGKSRGALGNFTIVQNGDALGAIRWTGADGVVGHRTAAGISVLVDGTPAAARIPAKIVFSTAAGLADNDSAAKWTIYASGVLEAATAQTIQTATGNLTLATAAGNGNILLTPHGTGLVTLSNTSSKLIVGHTASVSVASNEAISQIHGLTAPNSRWTIVRWGNNSGSAEQVIGKSRGTSVGSFTALQADDNIGAIAFAGADGTDLSVISSRIRGEVDGAVATGDVPGRLTFFTRASGGSLAEVMRLGSTGALGIISGQRIYLDGVALTGNTYLLESAADIVDLYANAVNVLRADGATALADGDTNLLLNRRAAGVEALQRVQWKDGASIGAGDKVLVLAA